MVRGTKVHDVVVQSVPSPFLWRLFQGVRFFSMSKGAYGRNKGLMRNYFPESKPTALRALSDAAFPWIIALDSGADRPYR